MNAAPYPMAASWSHTWSPAALAADNYGRDDWRAPSVPEGHAVLFAEPGRVLNRTCFRSHYFIVTKAEHGRAVLRVHHGAGEDAVSLRYDGSTERVLAALDSDARYLLLWQLYEVHSNAKSEAAEATAARWSQAFIDGRIRRRKVRGGDRVRVWIEPALAVPL